MKNAGEKPKAEKLSPKAKETIQISEEIYHQLMDSSGIGIGVYSLDGKIIMFNKKALQHLKGKTEDYVGKTLKEVFGEQAGSVYIQRIQAAAKSEKSLEFEDFVQMKSGDYWFLSNYSRIKNLDGEVVGVQVLAHDITERKKAEEKILKLNRIYAVISQINQAIVYHKNKNELFKEVCRIAIEFGKMQMAWIGLVDEQTKFIDPISFAGIEDGYLSKIKKISVKNIPEGHGPTGTALREIKHIVCNDIENDPQMAIWRNEALKRGYRSSIALPIIVFNNVIGVFSLYSDTPFFFDKEEEDLLDEVTMDISFALEVFETEEKQKQAEILLKESEERFRSLFEHMTEGVALHEMLYDKKGNPVDYRILSVNSAFEKFTEISSKKAISSLASELYGMTVPPYITEYAAVIKNGKPFSFETYFPPMDTYFHISVFSPNKNQFVTVFLDITERKHTELKLADDKKFIESLINITPDILYIYDIIDQKNIFSNDGIQKILGYSVHELQEMGNHIIPLLMHPDDFLKYQKIIIPKYSTAKDNESIMNEYRMKHKSGEWRWLYANEIIYLRQSNGSPKQIFGIIHDITERKQAEEALKKSEEKFRNLFNNSEVGMFRTRLDGSEILEFNDTYLKILNYTREEIIGKPSVNVWANKDERDKMVKTLIAEGLVTDFEFDLLNKLGEVRKCITSLRLYCETGILEGSIQDITDRKQAEDALKESEKRYHDLFNKVCEGLLLMSPEGKLVEVNSIFATMHGYTIDEILNMDIRNLDVLKEKTFDDKEKIIEQMQLGESIRFEVEHYHKDGHIFPLSVTSRIVKIGGQSYFLASHQDITEQKQAEKAIIESQRLGAIGEMASSIAHDFNNSLQSIFGNVDIAMFNKDLPEDTLEYLKAIKTAAKDAAARVQQIQRFGGKKLSGSKFAPVGINKTAYLL